MLGELLTHLGACGDGDGENVFIRVVHTEEEGEDLLLGLLVLDHQSASESRWEVRARGVREADLRMPRATWLELHEDHPLLIPHTARRTELFVRNAAEDPLGLMGELWKAHVAVAGSWIGPGKYFNWGYLAQGPSPSGGMGQLAEGPRPLLEQYAAVARRRGMQPTLLGDRPAVRWRDDGGWVDEDTNLRVLTLDESWCVAEAFSAKRVEE